MKYCIDTSAILTAWRRTYPPDVFPSVWTKIDELINQRKLIASEEVLIELEKKDDEVHAWARQRGQMFVPIEGQTQQVVRDILRRYPRLLDTRRNRSGADPFVIALAQIEGCVVVTNEGLSNSPARPQIPDICQALGNPCIDFVEMARRQNWRI
ncbi:MAG: DUF4411 family protein [Chloroflexi bacterium]|nr:DUF4411 family protein [Chloroflexota bacterium]